MKQIIYIVVILAILAGGYIYFTGAPSNNSLTDNYIDSNNITYDDGETVEDLKDNNTDDYFYEDENDNKKEGYVIETEVDGPEDCTSLEKYDPEASVCYIECDTPEACDAAEAKLDAALAALEDDFKDFSKDLKPFKGNAQDLEEKAEVVYQVNPGEKFVVISGTENNNHRKVIKWLAAISPNKFSDKYLSRVIPYTKPGADTMAYVTPDKDNPGKWDMYVNMDTMKDGEKEMVFTLIHEYTHILTLNSSQVSEDTPEEECQGYYVQEGCTGVSSYLNKFYQKFWDGKFNPRAASSDENYSQDPTAFFNEYAATNPGEDIAESFSSFVIKTAKDTSTVAGEKTVFFYSYPELMQIRDSIRGALKSLVREKAAQ